MGGAGQRPLVQCIPRETPLQSLPWLRQRCPWRGFALPPPSCPGLLPAPRGARLSVVGGTALAGAFGEPGVHEPVGELLVSCGAVGSDWGFAASRGPDTFIQQIEPSVVPAQSLLLGGGGDGGHGAVQPYSLGLCPKSGVGVALKDTQGHSAVPQAPGLWRAPRQPAGTGWSPGIQGLLHGLAADFRHIAWQRLMRRGASPSLPPPAPCARPWAGHPRKRCSVAARGRSVRHPPGLDRLQQSHGVSGQAGTAAPSRSRL